MALPRTPEALQRGPGKRGRIMPAIRPARPT